MIKYYQKIITFLLLIFFIGCTPKVTEYRYESVLIVDKNIETTERYTTYRLAFSDLTDWSVSFGIYSNFFVGDKLYFKIEDDGGTRNYWNSVIITEKEYRNNK